MSDPSVLSAPSSFGLISSFIRPRVVKKVAQFLGYPRHSDCSLNIIPSNIAELINSSSCDIVNIHWIGNETISLFDISRIRKPIVLTLHDMWPFCGSEHYVSDDSLAPWRHGYPGPFLRFSPPFLDLDYLSWSLKQAFWPPMQLVSPSKWLADCATESKLMHRRPCSIIPNTLNTAVFRPFLASSAKASLGLPQHCPIILFGCSGSIHDERKGFSHLLHALMLIMPVLPFSLVIFGDIPQPSPPDPVFPVIWLGRIEDDSQLALIYSAADVFVIPSLQEAFGQTASEAQACGLPVVAFRTTGLLDVVEHFVTGFLADPFCSSSLAEGLLWVLSDKDRHRSLSAACRQRAHSLWSYETVADQYIDIFESVLSSI